MDEIDPTTIDTGEAAVAPKSKADPRGLARGIITLLLIAVATLFALQNTESTEVEFLTWNFSVPLIVVMLAAALIGILIWAIARRIFRKSETSS